MNFLNLYYFLVVAEELNITKAAKRLFISQQSLSNHIMKLEKYFDVQLFSRTPSLSLTYAGVRLVHSATQMLNLKRQIINEMDDIRGHRRGELRIGISHTRGRVFLPKILPHFRKEHSLVDIFVFEGNSRQLEESLMHGHIDLLIGFAPVMLDEVETVFVLQERLFLVVPKKFIYELFPKNYEEMTTRLREDTDVRVFMNCPFLMLSPGNRIRTMFDRYMASLNLHLNVIIEMESIETLLALTCQGMGITIYPEMFVNNLSPLTLNDSNAPVEFFPLNDPSTIGSLVVGYHRERYLSDSAKDFIRYAKKIPVNGSEPIFDHEQS